MDFSRARSSPVTFPPFRINIVTTNMTLTTIMTMIPIIIIMTWIMAKNCSSVSLKISLGSSWNLKKTWKCLRFGLHLYMMTLMSNCGLQTSPFLLGWNQWRQKLELELERFPEIPCAPRLMDLQLLEPI